MHTQNHERLLGRVGLRLVDGMAGLVDAVAHVREAGDGADPGEAPGPAQQTEAASLDLLLVGRQAALLAEALAEGDLRLHGARRPARSAGEQRRALCRVCATAGELGLGDEVRRSEGPHGGSH